jgi:tetratricopeptide (TPR) repeat protein
MRPQFRREADGYHFVVPAFEEARREAVDQAYREGFEEGRRLEREDVQIERGGNAYQDAMADGNAAFSAGDYSLAARQFLLAATLNQGDPAARLCAAHTHIALGDYKPAVPLILRALELQPKIIYLPLDIRGAYGDRGTFDRHLRALEDAADDDAENVELAFLVGYCRFFSSDMPGAVEPLDRAARAMPRERAVVRMAELARTVAGRAGPKSTERR